MSVKVPVVCKTYMDGQDVVRDEARDFFEELISEGDFVCYPTGGTSSRMVLAYVLEVHRGKKSGGEYNKYWYDGYRGKSNMRLKVLRFQEGTSRLDPHPTEAPRSWDFDIKKKVSVDQLHRCVKVPPPAWAVQIANELGLPT